MHGKSTKSVGGRRNSLRRDSPRRGLVEPAAPANACWRLTDAQTLHGGLDGERMNELWVEGNVGPYWC